MVLLKVFRPAGQGGDGCYFLNDQKVTKESLEAASGEHLACGGAHSHCPQTPITGAGHFGPAVSSGGQNQVLFPFYSRALGPTDLKFIGGRLYRTPPGACLPVGCGGGRVDQLPRLCQSRRCPHSADTLKFLAR